MQGFCIYKKRLYWFTGDGSKRTAKVSVITFNGMVELSQQSLAFIDDKAGIVVGFQERLFRGGRHQDP